MTLLYPLDDFYARAGCPLPEVARITGEEVPEPYRTLLVHARDMTPTLEEHHGERIYLRVLGRRLEGASLLREVVLTTEMSHRPTEFGAIVIYTDRYPPAAQEEILASHCPLGTILASHAIEHESRPQAYFRLSADAIMQEALLLPGPAELYGRHNVLVTPAGVNLAEVVEILPPAG